MRVFSDGESKIRINANLLNKKCIVVQSTYPPVDSHLMQALMIIYSCYESGASEVIPVIPYMGYARQDKKFLEGEFATISLIAKLLECINIHNLITVDIHSIKAISYFNLNILNISSIRITCHLCQDQIKSSQSDSYFSRCRRYFPCQRIFPSNTIEIFCIK